VGAALIEVKTTSRSAGEARGGLRPFERCPKKPGVAELTTLVEIRSTTKIIVSLGDTAGGDPPGRHIPAPADHYLPSAASFVPTMP